MKDLRDNRGVTVGEAPSPWALLRGALAAIGVALVGVGAFGCVQLFLTAHAFVKDPQQHGAQLESWTAALGLQGATVEVAGDKIAIAGPVTFAMLFFGFAMLVFLLGRILKAGLSLLAWVRDDRRAAPPPVPAPGPAAGPSEPR